MMNARTSRLVIRLNPRAPQIVVHVNVRALAPMPALGEGCLFLYRWYFPGARLQIWVCFVSPHSNGAVQIRMGLELSESAGKQNQMDKRSRGHLGFSSDTRTAEKGCQQEVLMQSLTKGRKKHLNFFNRNFLETVRPHNH